MKEGAAESAIEKVLRDVNATGQVHVTNIDNGYEWGKGSDELVVTASVFKVPVLIELCRQASVGRLKLTDRLSIAADFMRTGGGTGLSLMLDDVELSLRDLAYLMMSVSDNRATDIIMDVLGLDAINGTIARFGLINTVVTDDCRGLFASAAEDLGEDFTDELLHSNDPVMQSRIAGLRILDASQTCHSTPRETSALFAALWRDEVIGPIAAAEARRILGEQAWVHRLTTGFPDPTTRISAKTGTLAFVRNEAGVVEYPDGERYAVSVFLRTSDSSPRNSAADTAIGTLARLAVDELRSQSGAIH